ncbi:MAG: ribosome small subunit-dependent GTPase A [Bdellovibrio sp.]|nr:ribosome small subunit-dependent GTPase A [Bdellovibrio sp.]
MSPKFRGNSKNWQSDWLDNTENTQSLRGPKKGKKPQGFIRLEGDSVPIDQANGIVEEVFPNLCRVIGLDPQQPGVLCSYRRVGVKGGRKDKRERSPVTVGDRVLFETTGANSGVVLSICERRNTLTRPAPGGESNRIHVLAANIEKLVIVASAVEPEFTCGLVDRFAVAAQAEGIPVLICVTKMDLVNADSDLAWKNYKTLGFSVVEVSIKRDQGVQDLLEALGKSEAVFCGHSGVGKTSLLQKLLGRPVGKTGEVNQQTGRGRHTTTSAVRYLGPLLQGWIDTPGVKEFGLADISSQSLLAFFPEMQGLGCPSPVCIHNGETGCKATHLFRYPSYRRILQSLLESESNR